MLTHHRLQNVRRTVGAIAVLVTVALGLSVAPAGASGHSVPKPTVVFVHGAFADAGSWSSSIRDLQVRGYPVIAPANPLRGLSSDSEYLKSVLATITGPVVLVGHSYGGAVITNAANGNPNVKALVYIAAYALEEGESVEQANHLGGANLDLLPYIDLRPYPDAPVIDPATGQRDLDAYLKQDTFRQIFAADVPVAKASVMAATQRPITLSSRGASSGPAAWKNIPSWYMVARNDQALPAVAERMMAARAGAKTVEVNSSHAAMVSHPQEVTALVLTAVRKTAA